jgi:hypothetical protein
MEQWKTLTRLPEYEISNYGKVRSLKRNTQKILKACETKQGYLLYCLQGKNKKYTSYAHRLVAEVFLPTPTLTQHEVNHKDKNVKNNFVENLEWVSSSENHFHRDIFQKDNPKLYEIYKLCFDFNDNQLEKVLAVVKNVAQ